MSCLKLERGELCCSEKKTKTLKCSHSWIEPKPGVYSRVSCRHTPGRDDVIVLGLPRGGVPVAFAVAGALHVPLDVFVVSKIGTPWNRELAMGAVAEGGVQVLDLTIVRALGVSEEDIKEVAAVARKELEYREELYCGDRPPLELTGETVILVDDGIATGCSILAAVAGIRRRKAARVVVAVPVAPASGCSAIRI